MYCLHRGSYVCPIFTCLLAPSKFHLHVDNNYTHPRWFFFLKTHSLSVFSSLSRTKIDTKCNRSNRFARNVFVFHSFIYSGTKTRKCTSKFISRLQLKMNTSASVYLHACRWSKKNKKIYKLRGWCCALSCRDYYCVIGWGKPNWRGRTSLHSK